MTQVLLECRRAHAVPWKRRATASGAADLVSADPDAGRARYANGCAPSMGGSATWGQYATVPPRTQFPDRGRGRAEVGALHASATQTSAPLRPPTRWGSPWHEVVESWRRNPSRPKSSTMTARPAFAIVDGCNRWRIVRNEDENPCHPARGQGPAVRTCCRSIRIDAATPASGGSAPIIVARARRFAPLHARMAERQWRHR